jgi:hypothetical protein
VSYETFLSLTLTALCVILAALGTVVAIAAVRGFQSIKDAASASAIEAVDKAVKRAIDEQFKLESVSQKIQDYIDSRVAFEADLILAYMPERSVGESSKSEPVADKYPENDERDKNESP